MAKKPSLSRLLNTRRLTREEAAKLGVSYKTRVSKDAKRITKKSKFFSDRQFAQAKLGGLSKEKFTASRAPKEYETKGGLKGLERGNLNLRELKAALKKYKGKQIDILLYGKPLYLYGDQKNRWVSTGFIYLGQEEKILEQSLSRPTMFGFDKNNKPKRFGFIVHE